MIYSYFDDSGDDKREQFVVSGGILAHHRLWNGFEERWRDETRDLKKPFHATDCEAQRDQFKTWPKERCDELMARLVTAIIGFRLGGFASIVPIAAFQTVFGIADKVAAANTAYRLTVAHTIVNIARVGELNGHAVKFWFESAETDAATVRIYNGLRKLRCWENKDLLKQISFGDKQLRPLQGADLVAREAFKHAYNLGKRPTRIPVSRLWERISFLLWTQDDLERLRERGWPDDLGALACWGGETNPFYAKLKDEK